MRLSVVLLCPAISFALVSGAHLDVPIKLESCVYLPANHILWEFKAILEEAIENIFKDPNVIPHLYMLTPEEYACYSAKCYKSTWCVDSERIPMVEWKDQIPSILCADNPAILELLSPELCNEILKTTHLAMYDAANLADSFANLSVFNGKSINLVELGAVKILKLLVEQDPMSRYGPLRLISKGMIETLQYYIDHDIWRPDEDSVILAAAFDAREGLLFLLKQVKPEPSKLLIQQILLNCHLEALVYIHSYSPQLKLTLEEINLVTIVGSSDILAWNVMVNPTSPQPSAVALKDACLFGRLNVIEWFLKTYYSQNVAGFTIDWQLGPDKIDYVASHGYLSIIRWLAFNNLSMRRPSIKAITEACQSGHFNILEWFLKRYHGRDLATFKPNWILSQQQIDLATMQGCVTILRWNYLVNPSFRLPSVAAVRQARETGHSEIIKWLYDLHPALSQLQDQFIILSIIIEALKI